MDKGKLFNTTGKACCVLDSTGTKTVFARHKCFTKDEICALFQSVLVLKMIFPITENSLKAMEMLQGVYEFCGGIPISTANSVQPIRMLLLT